MRDNPGDVASPIVWVTCGAYPGGKVAGGGRCSEEDMVVREQEGMELGQCWHAFELVRLPSHFHWLTI